MREEPVEDRGAVRQLQPVGGGLEAGLAWGCGLMVLRGFTPGTVTKSKRDTEKKLGGGRGAWASECL